MDKTVAMYHDLLNLYKLWKMYSWHHSDGLSPTKNNIPICKYATTPLTTDTSEPVKYQNGTKSCPSIKSFIKGSQSDL